MNILSMKDAETGLAVRSIEEEVCWQAIVDRDARFNSIVFYGVNSTGIYCKPSCPARRPRRDRVIFFKSYEAAEAKGFRACLRCRPREASIRDSRIEMVFRVCRIVEAEPANNRTLADLAKELGLSPYHLQRTFKDITGITPRQYAAALRLRQFKARIQEGADVTGALYDSGYGSSSRLYEKATERLGMTPANYRRGGKGMNINYTIVDCHLGRMLVAATERGVCSVQFGDQDDELSAALKTEYRAASIVRDEAGLDGHVSAILDHLGGSRPSLDLPLDLQASAFQLLVWEELRRIPYGATRSYGEVAASLGQPSATRAVARACATNPVALVTPCHRVVRSDGSLSGYRWGVERKQSLLTKERETASESTEDPNPPVSTKAMP